ncbi:glycosyl transferase [Haloferax sp. Atlit-6N]|uniref:glycosyltransferase n=1 Tax=Haloferax sp. Atlit-6N TaxID=2077205 RepID=UPI000E23C47D|nr:glycosyltransferase [Haloferax sp. Atlit-6N]REA03731.1 glycosyl transferase [Haloferax sp. Atlit-6N]
MTTLPVVVPAYEEPANLQRCLSALDGQPAEVVVVAAGSDHTDEVARDHPACDMVVRDDGRGPGAARNLGVDAASGEVVLFTDADTVVPAAWVRAHRRHYDDPNVVGVGGPARPLEDSLRHRVLFKLLSDYWYRVSWPVGFVQQPTFNCSYRRDVFETHGGFDETLPFMEDTELSLRLKDRGEVVYDPETEVATSARRERDEGYLSLFLTYARAYVSHYVRDRRVRGRYFDSQ